MTTEALPRISSPRMALRPVRPQDGLAPEGLRLDQFPITVGAGPTCKIRLTTPGARPLHCLLVETPRGVAVRRWAADTRLNGENFTESLLAVGDQITCGAVDFEVVEADDDFLDEPQKTHHQTPPLPVTWPASGPNDPSAWLNGQGRSATAPAEVPSLERASELVQLAEHCQRLEDELAETRSLLTSLGEELLQARELAAQQATKLTNRIDELEGDLAERDNLLMLLQEALEQRAESFNFEPGVDTATGFETESAASSHMPAMSPEPESAESGFEQAEAWGEVSIPSEQPLSDDLAEENVTDAPQAPPVPTPELEARLDAAPLPIEHEASSWVSASPEGSSPSDAPSFPTPSLSAEDLWDIEKTSSESRETSLWGEGTSSGAPASPNGHERNGDLAPEPTPPAIGGVPASDVDHVDPPQPTGEALDPWGSDSLWLTPSSSEGGDSVDLTGEESALLWGQSPSPELETEPQSPSAGGMLPERSPLAATEEAVPLTDPWTEAPIAGGPTSQAGTTEPLASDEHGAGPLHDDVHSSAETVAEGLIEDPQPKPKAAPVSFIEQYRHLLDDDGEDTSPASVEPAPVVSSAPPVASPGEAEDDSIEAYMAKMMARLRGESGPSAPASQAPPRPQSVEGPPVKPLVPQPPKPSPLLSLDEVKTAAVPERHTDMSALRDLANNSARHAIGMANSRRLNKQARSNLLLTLAAMSTGGYLVWAAPSTTSEQMVAGLIGVGGAALWGCRTLAFMIKARRESRGEQAREVQAAAAPTEDLLPIDVAPPHPPAPLQG